jgi:hypothetical protein
MQAANKWRKCIYVVDAFVAPVGHKKILATAMQDERID